MTTAPVADQRRLLDLQELDTRAAKLGHQRRSHPASTARGSNHQHFKEGLMEEAVVQDRVAKD